METQGELERERTWDRNYVNVVHMQEVLKNKFQTAATTKTSSMDQREHQR